MGGKNARARQARLQRKRNKRAAGRSARVQNASQNASPRVSSTSAQEMMYIAVQLCCQGLLAGEPLEGDSLGVARMARQDLDGLMGRLPFELNAFLFEGKPWTLTCADLTPWRGVFSRFDNEEIFDRLWSLSLTNEKDSGAFDQDVDGQDCAHRAASAFEQLRGCLEDRKCTPAQALRLIRMEAGRHGASADLCRRYESLLRTAVTAVHATPAKLPQQLEKLAAGTGEVFTRARAERAEEAWWECGLLFLQEVLGRLQKNPLATASAGYAALAKHVLDAQQVAIEAARNGHPEVLSALHLGADAGAWRGFLERALDPGALPFDERVRLQIAQLKLLRAQAASGRSSGVQMSEVLKAFQGLQNLLAHGVPPQSRDIPAALAAPLQDFYAAMVEELHGEAEALRVTEEQLRSHPQDFRLACLYATGAMQKNEPFRLKLLAQRPPVRHVAPELFAYSVRLWARAPRGNKSAGTLRELLFDPLDREDRKQCLIALSRQCLRRANSLNTYESELNAVLPYFPRDSFVLAELREKAALESSLVFLATMLAPLLGVKLALTEEQSQQWVSYAREIARQSRLGSDLVLRHLKSPSKWFTLAPAVLASARAQLSDFAPPQQQVKEVVPASKPRKRRARSKKKQESSTQQGLFDAFDP